MYLNYSYQYSIFNPLYVVYHNQYLLDVSDITITMINLTSYWCDGTTYPTADHTVLSVHPGAQAYLVNCP